MVLICVSQTLKLRALKRNAQRPQALVLFRTQALLSDWEERPLVFKELNNGTLILFAAVCSACAFVFVCACAPMCETACACQELFISSVYIPVFVSGCGLSPFAPFASATLCTPLKV